MDQDAVTNFLTCLCYEDDTPKKERLAKLFAKDWQDVTALVHRHTVAPLLYQTLRQMGVMYQMLC